MTDNFINTIQQDINKLKTDVAVIRVWIKFYGVLVPIFTLIFGFLMGFVVYKVL